MTLTITRTHIESDFVPHTARFVIDAADDGKGAWVVSWLPLRLFTSVQAITALTLSEVLATAESRTRFDPFIADWASELGLTRNDVLHAAEVQVWG